MENKNYFMVRAMRSSEKERDIFFKNNVVAIGFSKIDFSSYNDVGKLCDDVYDKYFADTKTYHPVVSKKLNEVKRFKSIKKGDYIIVPCLSNIALAEAEEEEIYSEDAFGVDLSNQHKVSYRRNANGQIVEIPRSALKEGLQRRLRVRGNSISNLFEFKEEIDKIFQNDSYSYFKNIQVEEQKELEKFKVNLLKNIQTGKTNLKTGGIGLEQLICELMKCEGYEAKVLSKREFPGNADADILAIKEDTFMSKKIFVQVKHHSGQSGKDGIRQIIAVLKLENYLDYGGYFITSAELSDEVRAFADKYDIGVMDGKALVELIVDNINGLSDDTKKRLGISMIPHILSTETI